MFLDAQDILNLSINGIYEPLETEVVGREVSAGDVVVDIGAHIGYYTLMLARIVGPCGKVYAFEPDPENFTLLQRNVKENGYRNVVLLQKAVSDRNGSATLYLSEDNSGDHRLYDSHDDRRVVQVETTTLDWVFRDYGGPIGFVKMDIQGAECAALNGMTGLLAANRVTKIMSEFWPAGLRACGFDPEKYAGLLADRGFRIFDLNGERRQVVPASLPHMLRELNSGARTYTNLFCVRDGASAHKR
jgi:FkbM family methyltransferase